MNIKELIFDETCYIVSNELKQEILSYLSNNKLLLDIHFFSLSELINRCYFKYDNKAIYEVSKEFNLSYSNAKIMINNLYYLMYSPKINDSKYNELIKLKNFLDDNNLLEYDPLFLTFISGYKIISDLSLANEFLYKINELLDNKIEFISLNEKENVNVYEFNDSEREIEYVANEIASLLNQGIKANMIHILNYNDSYYSYVNKIFNLYNIPFYLDNSNYLYDYPYIKSLYNDYLKDNELSFEDEYYDLSNKFKSLLEDSYSKDHLLYLLKNTKYIDDKYDNCIRFSSYEGTYLDDHYYFFIGLNNKVFPLYKKDEDYLSDELKSKLGYLPSYKINKLMKEYALNRLKSNVNIFISYRKSDYFNSYLKSDLVNLINEKVSYIDNENKYSKEYDKLKFTRRLDEFYKYNTKSNELTNLLTKFNKKEYKSYDNSYSKVDMNLYKSKILNNKLSISYSSFEKFNECNYKYYLDSIIKENESKFSTYIGSLFHHVLEKIYDKDFNFETAVSSFSSDYVLDDKEEILLDNLLIDFKDKITIILEQYDKGKYKDYKTEQKISIKKPGDLLIDINGFIDKVMFDDNNHAYVIDYKTGNVKPTLEYLKYGLKCQLPFYFYLLNKSKEHANKFLVGCYLQLINFKNKAHDDNSKDMQLEGFTYNNVDIVKGIDTEYETNSFIKGIKPNKNGLGTYAKVYDDEAFNSIITNMDNNINSMIENVSSGNFNINPKIIKQNETTCRFCKYSDICYHSFKDYLDIREELDNGEDKVD